MSHSADIISLASRRHRPGPEPGPARLEGSTEKGAWIVLVCALVFLAVGLALMFSETHVDRSISGLAAPERAAVFQRAYDDMRATCRLPAAAAGALLDRCRSTAWFVVLFPECDATCVSAARAFLPRARR